MPDGTSSNGTTAEFKEKYRQADLLAVVLYVLITLVPDEWPVLLRLAAGTALVVVYAAYTVWRDMPLAGLPVIGKYFRKR